MRELSRYLFLAGALPFLVLGVAHVLVTPRTPAERKGLSPADPALGEAMARARLLLTGGTDMWRCWVGFNLSHGIGVILFATVMLAAGRSPLVFNRDGHLFLPLAVLVSALYVRLAGRYWFRTPVLGTLLGFALFAAAALVFLFSMPVARAGGPPGAPPPACAILAVSDGPPPGPLGMENA